jgi:hypothetical protein
MEEVKNYRAELLQFLAQSLLAQDPRPVPGTVHIALSEIMTIVLTRLRKSYPNSRFRIVAKETVSKESYLEKHATYSGIDRENHSALYFGNYFVANVHLFFTWNCGVFEIGSGKKRFSYEEDFYGLLMDFAGKTVDSDIESWSLSLRPDLWISSALNTEVRCRDGEFQLSVQ